MNPKQMRKIRHKAKAILLAWIKTVVKKDQHHTITPEKFSILIKNPSYYCQGRTYVLSWDCTNFKEAPQLDLRGF